jgi:hypothetical protein
MKNSVKMFQAATGLVINVRAHHTTFKKAWNEVSMGMHSHAAKLVNEPRKAFGVYVIDAPIGCNDAIVSVFESLQFEIQ